MSIHSSFTIGKTERLYKPQIFEGGKHENIEEWNIGIRDAKPSATIANL